MQLTSTTMLALVNIPAQHGSNNLANGAHAALYGMGLEQGKCFFVFIVAAGAGHKPIVTDALKAPRQDMLHKALLMHRCR